MKKLRLKTLLKFGILIFGILTLTTNCEKNSPIESEPNEIIEDNASISITSVPYSDFDNTFDALKNKFNIDSHINNDSSSKTYSKTTSVKSNIVIYTDVVKKITKGDYASYTMLIESLDDDPNTFYNITIEEKNGTSGVFVTQYKTIPQKSSAKASFSKTSSSSSETLITTRTIDSPEEPIGPEDFGNEDGGTGSGGSSGGGGGSTTYPTDCDGIVSTTSVVIDTNCGCGHTVEDLMFGICTGCQTNYPTWPSRETVTVYECIPSSIDDPNTGGGTDTGGGTATPPPSEEDDSITTPVSPDGSNVAVTNLAQDLTLSSRQINWLNSNIQIAIDLGAFLTSNLYSEGAKEFAINAINLEMIISADHEITSTNKFPEELNNCCPGDCCPDVSLYSNDRIVYEYGIKPVQATIDATFNLIIGSSELIGSDAWVGSRIRKMMIELGIDVPTDIDNEHLSELYRIRKRDGIVIIEYRPGLLKSMLDVGLDTLDILAFLSPAKGGGPILFAKIGGSVSVTSISNHIRDITVTSIKIDNAVNDLKSVAKYILDGTGEFKIVGGHHPLAKIAFKSDKFYDLQKAFSVSKAKLDEISGITDIHFQITGQQNKLYSAFAKTGEVLTIEKMAEIEIKAMTNVGISKDVATGWVVKALEDIKAQGVKVITNIPWNGLN